MSRFLTGLFLFLAISAAGASPGYRTAIVSSPDHDCSETLVSAVLTPPAGFGGVIVRGPSGIVPCQYCPEGNKIRLMWIAGALGKGQSRAYRVEFAPGSKPKASQGVQIKRIAGAVTVALDGKPFTTLRFADGPKPYLYPVIGPTGDPVTRNYPMREVEGETRDHPHHRSWWFTFGDVNGVDFWSENGKAGRIVQTRLEVADYGPVLGRIRTQNDWVAPDGKIVCRDASEMRFYRVSSGRMADLDVTIRATEGPVTFGDTKEGMMGFRVASSMDVDRKQGHIVNSRGQKDGDAWGRAAEWCDYYGPVNGKTVGIAVMDHPSSFRHPTYWHVRTYGLFAANPFGIGDFPEGKGKDGSYTIPKGGELRFRYRVFIHTGAPDQVGVWRIFDTYARPPVVTVK
ncbi:MAG: PmoA family protein [Armatimonadetes bacterium]|nr:PmoA family protein [Armatimonadota bacterium]